MHVIIIFFCIITYITTTLAIENTIYSNKLNSCKVTTPAINDYEPENFASTNNLLRNTGAQPVFCGTRIVIKGKVLDENCVPVADAKIYLWQVGCDAKYPYQPLRNRINPKLLNLANESSFTGSGIATSNNKGEFVFVTIYPPSLANEKSHLNFRVEHYALGTLQTKFYLSNIHIAEGVADGALLGSSAVEDSRIYEVDIIVPGQINKRY